jgi:hypothetical protein
MSPAENNSVIYSEGREIITYLTEEGDDESHLFKISLDSSNSCVHWCKTNTTVRKEHEQRWNTKPGKCPLIKRNINPDPKTQPCFGVFKNVSCKELLVSCTYAKIITTHLYKVCVSWFIHIFNT